jgi:hypothetical protein
VVAATARPVFAAGPATAAARDFAGFVDASTAPRPPAFAADATAPPRPDGEAADAADAAAGLRLGVVGFGTVGRVVVVVRVVAAARACVPDLVGAFLAAAIWVFLLANDCGLVSAWRLRNPAWTQGVGAGVS